MRPKKWINHCSLAAKDPELEQQYLYAHGIRYKLRKELATQSEIKQELAKRKDEQEIRQILKKIFENEKNGKEIQD